MPRSDESALRGLVAAGPSLLSLSAAMRVRDIARLSAQDLTEAERRVTVKHAAPRPDQSRPDEPHKDQPRQDQPRERS